jgi:hypothetical protein
MGEIAEAVLNGDMCDECFECFEEAGEGFPRTCAACQAAARQAIAGFGQPVRKIKVKPKVKRDGDGVPVKPSRHGSGKKGRRG